MFFIIVLVIGIGLFFITKGKGNKKQDSRFKTFGVKKTDNSSLLDRLINAFSGKISLEHDTQFIKPSIIVEKCIRAGIRESDKHKVWIIMRFLGGVVGIFLLPILLYVGLGIEKIPVFIVAALGGMALGFYYPIVRLDSMIQDRKSEMDKAFPDFVDLTLVCVEAGMTPAQTYARIVDDLKKFSLVMADEIELLSKEITYFLSPKTAYDNFYYRTNNDFVKAFCGVVLQSIQYGTPLAQGLRSLSGEIREAQMGIVERKAAALPSKLTVPMMLFTLPVLFVVILYPAVYQIMNQTT